MQIRFLMACNGISLSIWRSTLKWLERTSLHFSRHPQAWFPRDVNHRRFRVSGLRGLINGVRLYDGDRLHRLIFARHNTDITNRKWSARNRVRVTCKCTSVTVITKARSNSERICETCRLFDIERRNIEFMEYIRRNIAKSIRILFIVAIFVLLLCAPGTIVYNYRWNPRNIVNIVSIRSIFINVSRFQALVKVNGDLISFLYSSEMKL